MEWVLGDFRSKGLMHIVTEHDPGRDGGHCPHVEVGAANAAEADGDPHLVWFEIRL